MKNVRPLFAGACFGIDLHKLCMVFFLTAGFLLASFTTKAQEPPCSLEGYTNMGTYNGHTYFISNFTAFASDAVTAAAAIGGHLATIADAGEDEFVANVAGGEFAWIGFNDVDAEGIFVWETGEPVTYTHWCPEEPNNYCCGGENWTTTNWFGCGWNDLYDGEEYGDYEFALPFVVEFDGVEQDDDCDGVLNCSDVCPGGNDNGPCNATSLPPTLPSSWYCSNNNNSVKVKICHNGNTLCVSQNVVNAHLAHGDYLGPCSSCNQNYAAPVDNINFEAGEELLPEFTVYPNPNNGDFKIAFDHTGSGIINIINTNGKISQRINVGKQQQLDINLTTPGVYLIQLITDQQILTQKITVMD